MSEKRQIRWTIFWSIFLTAFIAIQVSRGVTVTLEAYVSFSMTSSNGADLADGSVVYIMGSLDAVNDGMQEWQTNGGPVGFIANSTLGDDVYIGQVRVDMGALNAGGTFYAGPFYFDSTLVNYLYIRVFDTNGVPQGYVNWAASDVFPGDLYDPIAPVVYVDFNPDHNLSTTNYDYFYVVPEPGTAQLLMLTAGLMYGFRMCFVKKRGPSKP